jgi:hypothetical protein
MTKLYFIFTLLILFLISCKENNRKVEKYIDNINTCYQYTSGTLSDTGYIVGACENFMISIDSLEIITGLKSHITRGWVYAYMTREAYVRDSIQYKMWLMNH